MREQYSEIREQRAAKTVGAPERLARRAYTGDSERLARALLGRILVRTLDDGARLSGRIVETEAYVGQKDRASHAFGLRRTPRNEHMYSQPGTAYVYFTYGMHFCFNVVCGDVDVPLAVLVRALEPLEGLEAMERHRLAGPRGRRNGKPPAPRKSLRETELCSGPGRLCRSLAIDRLLNGADMVSDDRLFVAEPRGIELPRPREIVRTARIGVEGAGQPWAGKPLRFLIGGNPHVSR